jgi:preprotein translocase subunit SecG|uniref:Protein-export membrane protein SecG n=1 Tax=Chloracidobacterium thermophilum TaxID=458033 RepID=A8DJG2_9BACT|nr:preprotein translocase SecG subunit [Chloracidobacterium thermophilum]
MPWYAYVLFVLFVIVCLLLIGVVLLQPGKGDIALFGGGSQTAFGPRGAQKPLERVTFVLGGLFMALAFTFSIPGILLPRSAAAGIKDEPPPSKKEEKQKEETQPEAKKETGAGEATSESTPDKATPSTGEENAAKQGQSDQKTPSQSETGTGASSEAEPKQPDKPAAANK